MKLHTLTTALELAGTLLRSGRPHQPDTSGPTRWRVTREVDHATGRAYWRATPYARPEYRALFHTHADAMTYAQTKHEVP